eukprot:gene1590-3071_t
MASLSKMSIRGIRSFSPDRDETIECYSPLTMIVGANGCGKTSIIECLKAACTGTLPPNSRGGRSFINDPSMTDSTEVKANIKLRFMNKQSKPTVVVRSYQLTKKKNKQEFKALEGVVRMTNDKGEKVSISQKCTELDKHVPELLGVSSPIMENVIFCHQEENTWPLQDGAILKKKFDDIFESTRYSKALDAIMKAKKEFSARAKDLKVEVAELGAHLQSANEMRDRLDSCNEREQICRGNLDELTDRIQTVDAKLARCQDTLRKFQSSQKELQELQWKVAESERRVVEKGSSLEQELEGTDEQLRALMDDFDTEMVRKRNELMAMQRTVDGLNQDITALRDSNNQLQTRRGEAISIKSQLDTQRNQLQSHIGNLSTKYSIPHQQSTTSASSLSIPNIKTFLSHIDRKSREMQQESEQSLSTMRIQCNTSEKDCMSAHLEQQRHQMELQNKDQELAKIGREREAARGELAPAGGRRMNARSARDSAQQEYEEAQRQHDEFMRTYPDKANAMKGQLKDLSDRIRDLNDLVANDDRLLQDLSANRAENERLIAQERQTISDESACVEEAQSLFLKYRELLAGCVMPANAADMQGTLDHVGKNLYDLQKEIERQRLSLRTTSNDNSRLDADLAQNERRKNELQDKLRRLNYETEDLNECVVELNRLRALKKNPLAAVSLDNGLEAFINHCREEETLRSEEAMAYESANMWRNRFERKAIKNTATTSSSRGGGSSKSSSTSAASTGAGSMFICPCCDRDMEANQKQVFDENIKKFFKATPEATEAAKLRCEEAKTLMIRASAAVAKVLPIEEYKRELLLIDQNKPNLIQQKDYLLSMESRLEREILQHDTKINNMKSCQLEMSNLRTRWEDISLRRKDCMDRRARQSQSMAMADTGGRSFMEMEQELRTHKEEKDELIKKKESLQTEESRQMRVMFQLKQNVTDREKVLTEMRAKEARQVQLEARLVELDAQEKELQDERLRISQKTASADRDLKQKQTSLDVAKAELRRVEETSSTATVAMQGDRESLKRVIDSLEGLEKRAAAADLTSIEKDLERLQGDIANKEEIIRDHSPKIQALNANMSSQERTKRIVQDNLSLREAIQEKIQMTRQLAELNDRLGGGARAMQDAQREQQRAEQEKQKLITEQATLSGRLQELSQQASALEKTLNTGPYKEIDLKHRKKNIEYETTMMAVGDLESYFKALDGALMNFHSIKIKEVNKIVKELWQAIYRGEDIDTIEIISGEDGESSSVNAKRSYNYRVVMRKGDAPLDMRGRCSAGQCMLAGIVIRLALAESFCLTCGILALDEPTTNLDEPNKAGLAHALARLIANRSNQHSFQLLCITHDEDFVQLMRTELSSLSSFSLPEYYFRVSRQEEGNSGKFFSRIERIPWEDM